MYKNYKSFDYDKFITEYYYGDLSGLEYIEKTIIKEMKNKIEENNKKGVVCFTIEEYITSLFYAALELNNCMTIYEMEPKIKTNFNYNIYTLVRDKLFEELGFDVEDINKVVNELLCGVDTKRSVKNE